MVFSSSVFLFHFLPIIFLIAFFIKTKYTNYALIIGSLVFYAWGEPAFVLLMMLSIVSNWFFGIMVDKSKRKKMWLVTAVIFNLLIIGYFKYANFLIDIFNSIAGSQILAHAIITLPIGISFFTFQAISYVVDVYRGEVKHSDRLANVALYISFFPQLIAGPILKYKDVNSQIKNRTVTWENVSLGFRRFIYGLSKKVLIANVLGACVDHIFNLSIAGIDPAMAWIGAVAYTFQIYYDFSGYSDMAIGLGKMFGFEYPENFNYPYLSASIVEFWRRWHISLGTWFKEYVYIPLGGNKKGKARTYLNLIIVFLLTGLWHGADMSFVIWGLYHCFFSVIERLGLKNLLRRFKPVGIIYCFLVVLFGWVLFRSPDTVSAMQYIARMVLPWRYQSAEAIQTYLSAKTVFALVAGCIGAGLIQRIIPDALKEKLKYSVLESVYCVIILILSIAAIASNAYNPFIYFQF